MTGLVTRSAKGSPLTFAEMDDNIIELGQVALAYSNFGTFLPETLFDQYIIPFPIRLTKIFYRATFSDPVELIVGMGGTTQVIEFAQSNVTFDVNVNVNLTALQRVTFTTGAFTGDLTGLSITCVGTK